MENSLFSNDEHLLLPDAFDVFHSHFKSHVGFETEYKRIPEEMKIQFLRLASIYKNLVKDGKFNVPSETMPNSNLNYYELTYKFIALVSIIEAVVGKDEWLDFYEWLKISKSFSIKSKAELDELYKKYTTEYGVIKNIVKFFQTLDNEEKEFLKSKLIQYRIDNRRLVKFDSEVTDLAKLLYDLRSGFVHKARLIIELGDIPAFTNRKKGKPFTSNLSLNQLMRIFERSFLRYFGMQPEIKLPLF